MLPPVKSGRFVNPERRPYSSPPFDAVAGLRYNTRTFARLPSVSRPGAFRPPPSTRESSMKAPADCTSIEDVRHAIDAIDQDIVRALGLRYEYVKAITRFKKTEEDVRRSATRPLCRFAAPGRRSRPDLDRRLYRLLIDHFIAEEMKDLGLADAGPAMEPHRLPNAKIALVHDWLNQAGMPKTCWKNWRRSSPPLPSTPAFTRRSACPPPTAGGTSAPPSCRSCRASPTTTSATCRSTRWPSAQTDVSGYDLVLSNKSGFCHGVRTRRATPPHATSATA